MSLFVAGLVVARELGPEGRAIYAVTTALASAIFTVVHLSASDASGRLLARRDTTLEQSLRSLAFLGAAASLVGVLLFAIVAQLLQSSVLDGATNALLLACVWTIPAAIITQFAGGALLRIGRQSTFVWIQTFGAVTQMALAVGAALALGLTPELAAASLSISGAVTATLLLWRLGVASGGRALRPHFELFVLKPMLKFALRLHMGAVALALISRGDVLVMAGLTSDRQVGLYSLAVTLGELVLFAAVALAQAAMHHQTAEGEVDALRMTEGFVRQSWPIVVGLAMVLCVAASVGIGPVYGAEWRGAVPAIIVMTLGVTAIAVTGSLFNFLARTSEPRSLARPALAALAVKVVAIVLLVPPFGALGGALASFIGYWLYAALLVRMMRRHHGSRWGDLFGPPRQGDALMTFSRRRPEVTGR